MKKQSILALGLLILAAGAAGQVRPAAYPDEMKAAARFVQDHLSMMKSRPFSFLYGGRASASFLGSWELREAVKDLDENRSERTAVFTDRASGLVLTSTATIYKDFPAVEWVLKIKNTSKVKTPILEDIQALDTELPLPVKGDVTLHHSLGSDAKPSDFAPVDEPLAPGREIGLAALEGRSSGRGSFPFFNVEGQGGGVIAAIGWSGQWKAAVRRSAAGAVSVAAGMSRTHLSLLPGEEIRTPSIALLFWTGSDRLSGHNIFRRFVLRHHTPQKDGGPVVMPLASSAGNGGPAPCNENSCTTERWSIAMAYRYAQFGLAPEVWWIDAGWYDGSQAGWWQGVGNWTVNRTNFPNGLRPVADAAKSLGEGFCVWFEPERVYRGTKLDREHPDWLIRLPDPNETNSLLDFGNPAALHWLTDYVSDMIGKEGITVYRQDFNFDTQAYWKAADKPDRVGMSEIRHIEGLYWFWDELRRRNPGLLIDNCASGGRRIDLETISRSVPLWRTDYPFSEFSQSHTYGLHLYLPCNGTGNVSPDTYSWRTSISSALIYNWDIPSSFPLTRAVRLIAEYKRLRPYFYGDFYPLTPFSLRDDEWMAYQFDRPEAKDGMALAFRRSRCEALSCLVRFHGLDAGARYELNFEDYGLKIVSSGKALMEEGLEIKSPEPSSSVLITYRALGR